MKSAAMTLKVLLPYEILAVAAGVTRIVAETAEGSLGLLPNRLDCVAILVPGILTYQVNGADTFIAVNAGVLVKTGADVSVSVRNAIIGSSLSQLRAQVANHFMHLDEQERLTRTVLAKIEGGFIRRFQEIHRDR